MSYARQMLDTYRQPLAADAGLLAAAIDAATDCVQACAADTDANLGEQDLAEMVTCIRLCLDCADICTATAAVLSRPAEHDLNATRLLVGACAAICQTCGDECERHATCRIAGSAPRPAAAATGPAGTCWTPGTNRPVIALSRRAGAPPARCPDPRTRAGPRAGTTTQTRCDPPWG